MRRAAGSAGLAFLVSCLCLVLLYWHGEKAIIREVQRSLMQLAATAAVFVDGDIHKTFVSPEQEQTQSYQQAVAPLKRILAAHPEIRFLYTMVLHEGRPCFVLDATPPGDVDHDGVEDHSPIMQPLESSAPALSAALASGKVGVDPAPVKDPWGTYLSAYAPFLDSRGNFVGIVGVDLKLEKYDEYLGAMRRALGIGMVVAFGLSLLAGLGVWGSGRRALRAEMVKRQADEALQRSEENYRALENDYRMLFEQMVNGFALHEMIFDGAGKPVDYRFLAVNPAFEQLTGLKAEAILGKTVKEVLPQTESFWIEAYGEVTRTGVPLHCENYSQSLDRYFRVTAYRPKPGQFACIIADVSQQKRMEKERAQEQERLQQVQKLEGLGLLAGGIAHDFNNLLMAILGNADLAMDELPPGSPLVSSLGQIKSISLQAAELCKQMLAYSGKGKFMVEVVDVAHLVRDMAKLIEVSISKKVLLHYNLAENIPAIEADVSQVRQVVMNLMINASEAIGEEGGGVSLSTGVMECDETSLRGAYISEQCAPGSYVYIEVSDTGCGIDKELQSRIFDPFYTTKFTGRGLGLAAVMGIVRGHRGAIKVDSVPGKGSTFRVMFPASDKTATVAAQERRMAHWRGSGTILLADDEDMVRSVTRRMLERIGFDVIPATDGRDALALFKTNGDKLVCVLMDLTMPHMDGDKASAEMHRLRPDIPILLASGYNPQDLEDRFKGRGLAGFIQKPYQLSVLSATLRSVISGQGKKPG